MIVVPTIRAGTAHIVARSNSHYGFLISTFFYLFRILKMKASTVHWQMSHGLKSDVSSSIFIQASPASVRRPLFGLSGLSSLSGFWLGEPNQMNQINQINKTNQINPGQPVLLGHPAR
jgi:hypothetical protein